MLRFNPSWYSRILRNAEPEVHVTVIETPPLETPLPVIASVADAVADATQIVALADSMAKADPELLRRLDSIEEGQRFIVEQLGQLVTKTGIIETNTTVSAVADVIEEIEEEIIETAAVELPREEIPPAAVAPIEEPKKRGRRWI